jgi:putative glutamine amidotransferase
MRPRLGLIGELLGEKPEVRISLRVAAAVERAGGLPLILPPLPETLETLLESVDGLVFAGADDFDTARLGLGPTHAAARPVPAAKQDFDLALARAALGHQMPVLGICYGMQLLALAAGGTLHQHLPEDRPDGREHAGGVRHAVSLAAGTKLRQLCGVATLDVVSRHHQAVASVARPWTVAGTDDEGLIEAIEHAELPFAVGVQWHPELSMGAEDSPAHLLLFTRLVEAARARTVILEDVRP